MEFHRVRFMVQKHFFRSTHITEEHLFSKFPSILTFDFDLICGADFVFSMPKWSILGVGIRFKNCFGVSTYSATTLNSIFPSILKFDLVLILGSFWYFGALMDIFFLAGVNLQKLFAL